MAPKRRPAAAGEARENRRRVRVRPAAVVPPAPAREELALGAWVESGSLAVTDLTPGKKFQIEALYWDKSVEAAAELVGVAIKAGQMEVSFRVSGTSDEQLLKWLTAEEDRVLRGHLCPAGCSNSPQSEDLIHVKRLRLLEIDTPAWAQNLKEAAEAEVLRKLAAESDRRAREAKGKGVGAPAGEAAKGAATSESSCTSACGPRGESICKQGVEGGAEEQASKPTHLAECKRRQQEQRQDEGGGIQGQRQEGQGGQRQEGSRKGEREVRSPLERFTGQFIENELKRIAHEVHDGLQHDATEMPDASPGEMQYDHPEAAILVGTEREGSAVCGRSLHTELVEPEKKGLSGLGFEDVVGGLVGELSSFLRKTTTPGEVFPLPVDTALNQPFLSHLSKGVRSVLRGVVLGLNDVYDSQPQPCETVSPLHVRILLLLSEEVVRFLEKLPKFGDLSWREFLKVRTIDYKGEEVRTAQQTSWENISPALPDEVGTVELEDVVGAGCLHYVRNFEEYLLPREDQTYTKPPKVMVGVDQWEPFCKGLLSKSICGLIPESKVFHVQGKPLLNGLFGVLKEETHRGQEVHRLIMNLIPLDKLCRSITGDVSTLPSWPNMNAFQIHPDEALLVSSEDVRCFFYLFRVPVGWRPYLAFSRPVPPNLCGDSSEPHYLTSLVLPMGFCNSVSLAQHIHRFVVGRALDEARSLGLRGGWESELRKDRPLPISNPVHRVYLDNFDLLERVNSTMAEVVQGSVAPLASSLRQVYEELAIPRHPKKAVERQFQADVQGALVDGREGCAWPRPEKIMKYVQLSVLLLGETRCTQKQIQVVAGGRVYMAMFRRPLGVCDKF